MLTVGFLLLGVNSCGICTVIGYGERRRMVLMNRIALRLGYQGHGDWSLKTKSGNCPTSV